MLVDENLVSFNLRCSGVRIPLHHLGFRAGTEALGGAEKVIGDIHAQAKNEMGNANGCSSTAPAFTAT